MRVILDTNVFVAALRSRRGASFQVLLALRARRFDFVLSVPLFTEYRDVLMRPDMVPFSAPEIEEFLDLLAEAGMLQNIFFLWRPILRDAKDDMVLEAAVAGNATAIITFNVRDFSDAEQFGIEVLTPQQWLERLNENEMNESTRS